MISLGNRAIQGEYNAVLIAGELRVKDSRIRHLSAAGQVVLTKSTVDKLHCAGDLQADGVLCKRITVAGNSDLKGICKSDTVRIIGSVNAQYLEARIICNGSGNQNMKGRQTNNSTWQGVYHADTFENCGGLQMDFEYRFRNIINHAILSSTREIECELFYSFSELKAEAVNAERIVLLAQGDIEVGQLNGAFVMIKKAFKPDRLFKQLPKTMGFIKQNKPNQIAYINTIEADHIDVEYTRADFISGDEVRIGDLCIVKRVEYKKVITISEKAIVNEVVQV
jgi:hypothetical protein